MMTLAERVKEAIEAAKEKGHSVAHIAKRCGISVQAVYQWMDSSSKSIDGANLVELAESSGYHAMWIAKEKGPKKDPEHVMRARRLMLEMTEARQVDAVKIITPLVEPSNSPDPEPPLKPAPGRAKKLVTSGE